MSFPSKFNIRHKKYLLNEPCFVLGFTETLFLPFTQHIWLICRHINGSSIKTTVLPLSDPHLIMTHLVTATAPAKRACPASCFCTTFIWGTLGNFISLPRWCIVSPVPNTCSSVPSWGFFSWGCQYLCNYILIPGNTAPPLLLTHGPTCLKVHFLKFKFKNIHPTTYKINI